MKLRILVKFWQFQVPGSHRKFDKNKSKINKNFDKKQRDSDLPCSSLLRLQILIIFNINGPKNTLTRNWTAPLILGVLSVEFSFPFF